MKLKAKVRQKIVALGKGCSKKLLSLLIYLLIIF